MSRSKHQDLWVAASLMVLPSNGVILLHDLGTIVSVERGCLRVVDDRLSI